jgi:hypothetical protein
MAISTGAVSIFNKGEGITIKPVSSGGYINSEISDLLNDIAEIGKPIDQWCLWLDDVKLDKPMTTATFAKLRKTHNFHLEQVRRNRPGGGKYPTAVLRIVNKKTPVKETVKTAARLGR